MTTRELDHLPVRSWAPRGSSVKHQCRIWFSSESRPECDFHALTRELEMAHGVLVLPTNAQTIRVVFHHQITDAGVQRLVNGFIESVLSLAQGDPLSEIMMS